MQKAAPKCCCFAAAEPAVCIGGRRCMKTNRILKELSRRCTYSSVFAKQAGLQAGFADLAGPDSDSAMTGIYWHIPFGNNF